ncbi:MAG: hypothetical protein ABW137_18830 [Mycobacterium sp.]
MSRNGRRLAARAAGMAVGMAAAALIPAAVAAAEPSGDAGYNGAPIQVSGGPVPTLAGVPCVASNLGVCSSIAQNQPGRTVPRSAVGSSPTIVR